jgi:hypothetical protein
MGTTVGVETTIRALKYQPGIYPVYRRADGTTYAKINDDTHRLVQWTDYSQGWLRVGEDESLNPNEIVHYVGITTNQSD